MVQVQKKGLAGFGKLKASTAVCLSVGSMHPNCIYLHNGVEEKVIMYASVERLGRDASVCPSLISHPMASSMREGPLCRI
jgi:hypothetical protein